MKRYILFTLLGLTMVVAGRALAKTPMVWNQGDLFLTNGTELTGDLNYNWKAEIVQIRQGDAIKAYSAFQVQSFRYFDDKLNTLRTFASVEMPVRTSLRRTLFMEQVVVGPMTVYRRLRHMREPILTANPSGFSNDAELVKDYDNFDYVVNEGDTIVSLDKFSNELWPSMHQEFGDELDQYASSLRADRSSTLARLLLINRYNSLKDQASASPVHTPSQGHQGTHTGQ